MLTERQIAPCRQGGSRIYDQFGRLYRRTNFGVVRRINSSFDNAGGRLGGVDHRTQLRTRFGLGQADVRVGGGVSRQVVRRDGVIVDQGPLPPPSTKPDVEQGAAERPDATQHSLEIAVIVEDPAGSACSA